MIDIFWGAAYLLAFALAPAVLPEASLSATGSAGSLYGAAALLVLGAMTAAMVALWRRRLRVGSALLAAAVLSALTCSAFLRGDRGPTLSGVWYVAPFEWLALAGIAALGLRTIRPDTGLRARIAAGCLTLAAGTASFVIASPRIGSREAVWQGVLRRAPASQTDAVAFARSLDARSRHSEATRVLALCVANDVAACDCHLRLAESYVSDGAIGEAAGVLDHADPPCTQTARGHALRAETLAARGSFHEGLVEADAALHLDPTDPHAVYAKALCLTGEGDQGGARVLAEQASLLGRGRPAAILLGYIEMQRGDLEGAEADFERIRLEDPENWVVVYNLAVIADRRGQYRRAREGYLEALRLDPQEASPRYDLSVLAHGIGADDEARHHRDEFLKRAPGDPRVAKLQALLP